MKKRDFDGHIVITNSIVGHHVPSIATVGFLNIYPPSKFAVTAMVETYRQEFANAGTKVKVTSISPGIVETEINPQVINELKKAGTPMLQPENIADGILYVLSTPPHVQVHELTIQSVGEFS